MKSIPVYVKPNKPQSLGASVCDLISCLVLCYPWRLPSILTSMINVCLARDMCPHNCSSAHGIERLTSQKRSLLGPDRSFCATRRDNRPWGGPSVCSICCCGGHCRLLSYRLVVCRIQFEQAFQCLHVQHCRCQLLVHLPALNLLNGERSTCCPRIWLGYVADQGFEHEMPSWCCKAFIL